MSTISTLCATSTVGVAVCGLALAVPAQCASGEPIAADNTASQSPPPPPSRMSNMTQHDTPSQQSSSPPSGVRSYSSLSRYSSSKKWFRRLSESFSSSPSGSFFRSSSPQPSQSRSGSRSPSFSLSRPNSRINTSTQSKLGKGSTSRRASSRSSSPLVTQPQPLQPQLQSMPPRPQRRPSTTINQLPTPPDRPAHTSHLDLTDSSSRRTSTTGFDSSLCRQSSSPAPVPVPAWQRYFPAKRPQSDSKKTSAIRKLIPDRLRRRSGPTLVLASAVETDMDEATMPSTTGAGASDAMSVYSELASLYPQSRPVSRHKNDPSETNTRPRAHSSAGILPPMPPLPSSEPPRRTFSVANFLNRSKSVSSPRVLEEKSTPNTFVGFCVGSTGRRFSFSAPPDSHTLHPYQQWTGPVTPGIDELYQQNEELSIIQSVSRLGIDTDPDEDGGVRLSMESSHESDSRGTSTSHSPNTTFTSELGTTTPESPPRPLHGRPHRLSLMSGSERASTLVGSDSEHEFGSDTLFDSIRTRISQLTPVRADAIFNFDGSASRTRSPTYAKSEGFFLGDDDETPVKRSTPQQASPDSARTARGVVPKISFDDDEDCWSTSDWNAPSRSGDVATNRLSAPSGLRPFNRLLTASQGALSSHSTESNTTYGTAQEVLSVASSREASSVLDWDDGNSVKASSPTRNSLRPKIIQAPENDISAYRPTHRLPNYQHARSQSMPLSQTLRGRVPSENWDDDFLDEDDEDGAGKGGMVIPRGIQERQASIIGHLGCVREFALLVEDLKRLRDDAIAKNIRYGADCLLWDEADGIIALATVDDDDDAKILQREKLQRQHTWAPGQTLEYTSPQKPTNAVPRRSVVLCPGDDIFGPQGPPTPTLAECQQASHTTSSPHRRIVDRNDPIEVAKSMMEKMQQHRAEKMGSQTDFEMSGKTHFDTDMLKDLVIHVNQLKRDLTRVISTTSPPGFLKMKPQPPDSEMEGRFNFSLTPRHSFDNRDALANGFDPLENGAMEFRSSAIGIAS